MEKRDEQLVVRWEQEQGVVDAFYRAAQIPFFSLAATEALTARIDAAMQVQAVIAASSTAPVPTAPGGRAVSDLSLTPRLLGQRPQDARAYRAG